MQRHVPRNFVTTFGPRRHKLSNSPSHHTLGTRQHHTISSNKIRHYQLASESSSWNRMKVKHSWSAKGPKRCQSLAFQQNLQWSKTLRINAKLQRTSYFWNCAIHTHQVLTTTSRKHVLVSVIRTNNASFAAFSSFGGTKNTYKRNSYQLIETYCLLHSLSSMWPFKERRDTKCISLGLTT